MFYRSDGRVAGADRSPRAARRPRRERQGARRAVSARSRVIYERELDDDDAALDAYREADRLAARPPRGARRARAARDRVSATPTDEALAALERLGDVITDAEGARAARCAAPPSSRSSTTGTRRRALYERARKDDPDLAPAVDGLVDPAPRPRPARRGDRAARQGGASARRTARALALARRRRRLLRRARRHRLGEAALSRCAHRRPGEPCAPASRSSSCAPTVAISRELAPILDELCRTTEDPGRLRGYLLQRSKVAAELGDQHRRAQRAVARGRARSATISRAAPRARRHAVRRTAVGEGARR